MDNLDDQVEGKREQNYGINPIFLNRYSPRSLGRDMTEEDLMACFEAARWAPSSYNNQSWRFVYSKYNDEYWEDFIDLLGNFNKKWAENSFSLILVLSKTTFDHNNEESITHSFDTGAAWENLALEAADRGLVAHGMEGFDYELARKKFDLPEEFEVEAMIAVGSREDETDLPEDMRVEPNQRKELSKIIFQGKFSP